MLQRTTCCTFRRPAVTEHIGKSLDSWRPITLNWPFKVILHTHGHGAAFSQVVTKTFSHHMRPESKFSPGTELCVLGVAMGNLIMRCCQWSLFKLLFQEDKLSKPICQLRKKWLNFLKEDLQECCWNCWLVYSSSKITLKSKFGIIWDVETKSYALLLHPAGIRSPPIPRITNLRRVIDFYLLHSSTPVLTIVIL